MKTDENDVHTLALIYVSVLSASKPSFFTIRIIISPATKFKSTYNPKTQFPVSRPS